MGPRCLLSACALFALARHTSCVSMFSEDVFVCLCLGVSKLCVATHAYLGHMSAVYLGVLCRCVH